MNTKLKFTKEGSFEQAPTLSTASANGVTYYPNNAIGVSVNGYNDYYDILNALIDASPTTSACIDILSMLSYGKGINFQQIKESNPEFYNYLTNNISIFDEEQNVNHLLKLITTDYIKYNGFSIAITTNKKGQISSLTHLPFDGVRIVEIDNLKQPIKYVWSNDWNYKMSANLRLIMEGDSFKINEPILPDNKYIFVYRTPAKYSLYPTPYWESCIDSMRFEYEKNASSSSLFINGAGETPIVIRNYNTVENVVVGSHIDGVTGERIDVTKNSIELELEAFRKSFTNINGESNALFLAAPINIVDNDTSIKPIEVLSVGGVDKDLLAFYTSDNKKNIYAAFGVPIDLIEASSNTGLSSSSDYINELYNRLQNTKVNAIQQLILRKLQTLINLTPFSKQEELIIDLFTDTNENKTKATSDTSTQSDTTSLNKSNTK